VDELKKRLIDEWNALTSRSWMLLSPNGGVIVSTLVFVWAGTLWAPSI